MNKSSKFRQIVIHYFRNAGIAVLAVTAAVLMRRYLLGALEGRIVWVTFYPAVVIASIYGGWFAGILVAGSACLVASQGWWLIWNSPFIKDYGDWLGLFAFLFNGLMITAVAEMMRRAKKQAEKDRVEAQNANKAKSIFLANMSHELRTPLNAILGFSNLLKKTPELSPTSRNYCQIIANSGENLLTLINNILNISKVEAGHMLLEEAPVNLRQLLHELESLLSVRIREKGIHFQLSFPTDFPESLVLDGGKLRQILTNLIANATKFTHTGGISVIVSCNKSNSQKQVLRFEVKDTGIGIHEQDWQNIFQPFKQAGARPENQSGTGLGLSICKQFVELMGGSIGLHSELGKGSLFYFEIPAVLSTASSASVAPEPGKQISGRKPGQPVYRILIAEDKLENRLLLKSILAPLGLEIREAINGLEAVAQFEEWQPHLIFMDIRMPVLDGAEATKRIRQSKKGAETRVVALTAHALEEERIQILRSGCDDVLRKPYRDSEIFDSLSKHLGVQFVYETDTKGTEAGPYTLSFAGIPNDQRERLYQAVILLDRTLALDSIDSIAVLNSTLGGQLRILVDNLQFGVIIDTLNKYKNEVSE
jgi:signal transduction histidine kinase/CheY-like chemotaxis protein